MIFIHIGRLTPLMVMLSFILVTLCCSFARAYDLSFDQWFLVLLFENAVRSWIADVPHMIIDVIILLMIMDASIFALFL
jgi:hypothetical protein